MAPICKHLNALLSFDLSFSQFFGHFFVDSDFLPEHEIEEDGGSQCRKTDPNVKHDDNVSKREADDVLVNKIVIDDVKDVGHQRLDEDEVGLAQAVKRGQDDEAEDKEWVSGAQLVDQLANGIKVFDVHYCGQERRPAMESWFFSDLGKWCQI